MPENFSNNEGGDFLKEKYPDLPKSPEVESAVKRQEIRENEEVGNDPKEKIGAYLDRLNEIFNPENADKKERRVDILKDKLHDKLIIKEVPENYFKQQQKIAHEQGHGDIEITDRLREEALKTITADQKQGLDNWIDYLGSSDATYPDWLKYWAFRSITGLSQYDKETHEFKKRSKSTTAPFPDINREALAYVLDAVEKQQKEKAEKKGKKKTETEIQQPTNEEWEKLLKSQNFAKLYAHAIEKITPASEEEKESIQGEWVKYEQNSDAKPLYESLQGHGTGWCTAGESTAEAQLELGDFYVFYTKDKSGAYKIPRIAVRMQGDEVAEVRGINAGQSLEPDMTDIVVEKMKTLSGGEKYEKKVSDMKRITEIENKMEKNEELTKEDLIFFYEIGNKIEGFGYGDDPRVEHLTMGRNIKNDLAVVFDCKPEQVMIHEGFSPEKVSEETVVVKGNLDASKFPFMFQNLAFVWGDVKFTDSKIKELPKLQAIDGSAFFEYSEIENLGELVSIGIDANFQGSMVKDLPKLQRIGGSAFFEDSEIENLGQLISIGRKADFSHSKVKSLGQLREIGSEATFSDSLIEDLGELRSIGGDAYFGLAIKNLGKLKNISGDVLVDKNSKLDFSNVEIGGHIIQTEG